MRFVAKAKFIRISPYKLRPLADVVRGKNALFALQWLSTCALQKAMPVKKALESAVANAKNLQNMDAEQLLVTDIRIDQGPIHRYFKPGAQGRANIQRKRLSHISVVLERIKSKEA